MELLLIIALCSAALIWVLLLWLMYANKQTLAQRLNMLRQTQFNESDDLDSILKKTAEINRIRSVPYDKHRLYIVTFRDPMQLYKDS